MTFQSQTIHESRATSVTSWHCGLRWQAAPLLLLRFGATCKKDAGIFVRTNQPFDCF